MVREKMRAMRAHVAKMSELFHEADTWTVWSFGFGVGDLGFWVWGLGF